MATHKSAEKRARQALKRHERRQYWRSRVKTVVKRVRTSPEVPEAAEAFRNAESVLRRAASKGAIPRSRASRIVSRLARQLHRAGSH